MHRSAGPVSLTATASGCGLPLTYDAYQGFRVGVPRGWEVSSLGGLVEVASDASGTEAALMYPAALTKGLTPASFFQAVIDHEQKLVASAGGSLQMKMQPSPTHLPLASIQIRGTRGVLAGQATVLLVSLPTQFSSQVAVFSAWWAPPQRLRPDSKLLAAIGGCYRPAPAELYQIFRDQSFTYIMPPGWRVLDEGQDNIDLRGNSDNAAVSYLFFGIPPQYDTPPLALAHIFAVEGVTVSSVLSITALPTQQLSSGGAQGQQYEEFLGRAAGKAIHGLVYILTDAGSTGTFGVMRFGASTTSLWNSVNGGLIEMMGAIQHSFVQDLQNIQRLNQQWQAESAQEQNFDDIINGQQLVQDPTTGQLYEAPYSSWDPSGPDGAGYYDSNGRLNPVSH
jgi:hypothetical protein